MNGVQMNVPAYTVDHIIILKKNLNKKLVHGPKLSLIHKKSGIHVTLFTGRK